MLLRSVSLLTRKPFSAQADKALTGGRECCINQYRKSQTIHVCAQGLFVYEEFWPHCEQYLSYVLKYGEESSICYSDSGFMPEDLQADLSYMFCLEFQEYFVDACPRYEKVTKLYMNRLTFERYDRAFLGAEFENGKLRFPGGYNTSKINMKVISEALRSDRTIGKARMLVEIRLVHKFRSESSSNNMLSVVLPVDIREYSFVKDLPFSSDADEIQRFLHTHSISWWMYSHHNSSEVFRLRSEGYYGP